MFFYTVNRHERKQDRCLLDVCLIFRILTVCEVLTDLESACSAEHHIDDSNVADGCDYPLPECAACAKAYDERSGPDYKFAEVVRTAYKTVYSSLLPPRG